MGVADDPKRFKTRPDDTVANYTISEVGQTLFGLELSSLPFHNQDIVSKITYLGYSSPTRWLLKQFDETNRDAPVMLYAVIENNSLYTTYAAAWANRLTLSYDLIENIF